MKKLSVKRPLAEFGSLQCPSPLNFELSIQNYIIELYPTRIKLCSKNFHPRCSRDMDQNEGGVRYNVSGPITFCHYTKRFPFRDQSRVSILFVVSLLSLTTVDNRGHLCFICTRVCAVFLSLVISSFSLA